MRMTKVEETYYRFYNLKVKTGAILKWFKKQYKYATTAVSAVSFTLSPSHSLTFPFDVNRAT